MGEVELIEAALAEVSDLPVDHEEALQYAIIHRADSNLARGYLNLRARSTRQALKDTSNAE